MERKTVSGIMLILLLIGMLTLTFSIQLAKSEPTTIIVPDDYPTIQEAINAASDGDTIFVRTGIYYENVVVNKSVLLIGENRKNTAIDGRKADDTVMVIADNVIIEGFTIRNSSKWTSGIRLNISNYNRISGNNIINNGGGIILYRSSNNIISKNNITINNPYFGIYLSESSNNSFLKNNVTNNDGGIILRRSSNYNAISGNNITANKWYGIYLFESSNYNSISGNNITNNRDGIYLSDSSNNTIFHNNFVNNLRQVYSERSLNSWDNGYPSGGNYWSDYAGLDADGDGIGDTPYVIDENNKDRYPLLPSSPFWMRYWFWAIIVVGIILLAGTVYFLKKRHSPTLPFHG